jgi:hypothetical protein
MVPLLYKGGLKPGPKKRKKEIKKKKKNGGECAPGFRGRAVRVLRRVFVLERALDRRKRRAPRGRRGVHVREPRVELRPSAPAPRALCACSDRGRNTHDPYRTNGAFRINWTDGTNGAFRINWTDGAPRTVRANGASGTDGAHKPNGNKPGGIPARNGLRRLVRSDRGGHVARVSYYDRRVAQSVGVRALESV